MVFVRFKQKDSHGHLATTMTREQATVLDQVMKGLVNGSQRQREFASNVEKIYWGDKRQQGGAVSEQVQELWPVVERKDLL